MSVHLAPRPHQAFGQASGRALLGLLAALVVLLGAPVLSFAQNSKLHMERLGFDKLPDLRVYLTYVEGDGTPITGKTAADFKLLLDSAEQGAATKLVTFDQSQEPIYIIGVAQLSPAMEPVIDEIKKGLRQLADSLGPLKGSKLGILGYSSDVKRLVDPPMNGSEAEGPIGKLAVDPEGTEVHMLDALRTAIDLLNAQPKGRKLIVLFSDGIDVNNEKKAFTEIGRRAQQSGVVIDTIGYAPFEPGKLRNLQELSKNSYGTDRGCKAPTEIGPRFSALLDEIQKQYVVTFALPIQGDDKEHGFQVLHEAGGKPVYSQTVNDKLPSFVCPGGGPPPCAKVVEGQKEGRKWWFWLLAIGGPLGVGALAWALLRKPAPPMPQQQAPVMGAPMLSPNRANKTIALDATGDVAMGWIMGLNGNYKDKTYKLKARTVIGTGTDCDIVIQDGFMSAHHCEIRQAPEGFKLVDLGATNGVMVNDKKVREHFLVDNDAFRLGRSEFKFKAII